jgi:hypothetical protein
MSKDNVIKMKQSIVQLMRSSGNDKANFLTTQQESSSILELLNTFRVGTEKSKVFHGHARTEELVPLQLMNISSNTELVKSFDKKREYIINCYFKL